MESTMREVYSEAPVRPAELNKVLPYALPWLEKTIEYNCFGYTLDEIVEHLRRGVFQLWGIVGEDYKGFVVTELVGNPPILNIFLGGGENFDQFIDKIAVIETWARNFGCRQVKVWGRKGWERKLRPQGYGFETQVLHKFLDYRVN